MFKLSRTFKNAGSPEAAQRGFPAPGAGDQTVGDFTPPGLEPAWAAMLPTQGAVSWTDPSGYNTPPGARDQQGYPSPLGPSQRRRGWGRGPVASGLPIDVVSPQFSRGAARTVHNYGKVLTNPIGAGVVALYRAQASYGSSAQYENGQIFWTSQAVPTSVRFQGLTSPDELAAVLGPINVQAVLRTTG